MLISGTRVSTLEPSIDLSNKSESRYDISTDPLRLFTGLTSLDLSETGITELDVLGEMTGIKKLDVSGNENLKIIGALIHLEALEELDISATSVTDLNVFWGEDTARFSALTTLNAKNISTLTSIAGLVQVAAEDGFDATDKTWDLSGSTLPSDPDGHINQINTNFGNGTFDEPDVSGTP